MRKWIAVAALSCLTAACLTQENRHAFYLEPDGSATWTVTEEEVRSDADESAEREREEREYLDAAQRGDQRVARALRGLGASWVETRVVREERPFTVVTEARFASAARMLEEFLVQLGLEAEATLDVGLCRTRLVFRFSEKAGESDEGAEVEALLEPAEGYRFVLTEGRFVESRGFRLERDETVAVMLDPDEQEYEGETAVYELTWELSSER